MSLLAWHGVVASGGTLGPDGTTKHVEFSIQASQVDSALTDYPMFVRLSNMPAGFWTSVQTDGGDIRATLANGTRLPLELVAFDHAGSKGEVYTKVPSVSASVNTPVRIWFSGGGSLTQPAAASTFGSQNVWASHYAGVWHLAEASGNRLDSSATGSTLSVVGDVTAPTTGYYGGRAADFENSAGVSGLERASASLGILDITGNMTLSVLYNMESGGTLSLMRISGSGTSTRQWALEVNTSTTTLSLVYSNGSANTTLSVTDALFTTGTWVNVWISANIAAKTGVCFVNGISKTVGSAGTPTSIQNIVRDFQLGSSWTSTQSWDGLIEEARASNTQLSSGWGRAVSVNQYTPLTFYAVGPVVG